MCTSVYMLHALLLAGSRAIACLFARVRYVCACSVGARHTTVLAAIRWLALRCGAKAARAALSCGEDVRTNIHVRMLVWPGSASESRVCAGDG